MSFHIDPATNTLQPTPVAPGAVAPAATFQQPSLPALPFLPGFPAATGAATGAAEGLPADGGTASGTPALTFPPPMDPAILAQHMAAAGPFPPLPLPLLPPLPRMEPSSAANNTNPRNDRHFWKEAEQHELLRLVADTSYRQSILGERVCLLAYALFAGSYGVLGWCVGYGACGTHTTAGGVQPFSCLVCLPPATCRHLGAQLGRDCQAPGARQALGAAQV